MIVRRSRFKPSFQWLKSSFLSFIILFIITFIIYKSVDNTIYVRYDNISLNGQNSVATTHLSTAPLSELTRNHINDVECQEHLVPMYDRIVDPLDNDEQNYRVTFIWHGAGGLIRLRASVCQWIR